MAGGRCYEVYTNIEDICGLMRYQCIRLAYYHLMYYKYPTTADSIENAICQSCLIKVLMTGSLSTLNFWYFGEWESSKAHLRLVWRLTLYQKREVNALFI